MTTTCGSESSTACDGLLAVLGLPHHLDVAACGEKKRRSTARTEGESSTSRTRITRVRPPPIGQLPPSRRTRSTSSPASRLCLVR